MNTVHLPDGTPIAYESLGDGDVALVLVHGWSCDGSYWEPQLESLSRDFRVVTVDLAGHGESGEERETWSIASFGEDVTAVVSALGLERVVLVGHSMGGDVILETARRLPGRVLGLIWVDVYQQIGAPRTEDELEAFQVRFRANFVEATRSFVRGMFPHDADPALVERVAADMASAPREIALPVAKAAQSYDREIPRALRELKLPLIAINPDSPPTDVDSMNEHGIEVVLMPGVGHFPMLESPERFERVLREAVRRVCSTMPGTLPHPSASTNR